MKKFQMEEGKIYMTTEIKEGDVLILENGNYEIIRTIDQNTGTIKSTIIDPEDMSYCKCEITISKFFEPENMENYYTKMEEM